MKKVDERDFIFSKMNMVPGCPTIISSTHRLLMQVLNFSMILKVCLKELKILLKLKLTLKSSRTRLKA